MRRIRLGPCANRTSSGEGSAMVGHHDRFRFTSPGSPWNEAHPSRGCSQQALVATGGDGLLYGFALAASHRDAER